MRRVLVGALWCAVGGLLTPVSYGIAKEMDGDVPLTGISASLQPDPFTGTLTGSIPIEVPPGRNGMQPNLNLIYESAGGNGWVGMGWKLELGAIERQTRWGVLYTPTAAEEQAGKVYTMRLNGVSTDLVQDSTDPLLYHEKVKNGFLRIKKLSTDGTAGWEITDTKGTKYKFGIGSTTRIQGTVASVTQIFRWCLERVEDRDGNYLTVTYQGDGTTNQGYLSQIDYAGNGATTPTNQVKFYLEGRTDTPVMYTSYFPITTAKRLKTIEVKANGTVVRAYKLSYVQSATVFSSTLTAVQQFGRDVTIDVVGTITGGTVLPTVSLSYSGGSSGYSVSFSGPVWSDANGWGAAEHYSTIQHPDVNGDGKADICGRSSVGIGCSLGTGTGFTGGFAGPGLSSPGWSDPKYYSTIRYPDVDGDGRADVCGRSGVGIICWLSTGSGFNGGQFNGPAWSDANGWGAEEHYSTIQYPDLNGDGKADICARSSGGITCSLGTGTGFTGGFAAGLALTSPGWADPKYNHTIRYPDLNGDGKADFCARSTSGIFCHLSTGSGFNGGQFSGPAWSDANGWGAEEHYSTIQYPDLNGDGKADICARSSGGITCSLGTGTGFIGGFAGGPALTSPAWADPKYNPRFSILT